MKITKEQQRKNRLKLADMLEYRVRDDQFKMITWTNECGTVGCALGIAVLSGEFEGLGWNRFFKNSIRPVVRGHFVDWEYAGLNFFGKSAADLDKGIFFEFSKSRIEVAKLLREAK